MKTPLKPAKVLFVCVENSRRSQMAEGLARAFGGGLIEPYSAGSDPSGTIDPAVTKVMRGIGLDISGQSSKGFRDLAGIEFDYVVSLGCGDTCPFVAAKKHLSWNIEDPKGKPDDFFRLTRDRIKVKVRDLARQIKKEAGHGTPL